MIGDRLPIRDYHPHSTQTIAREIGTDIIRWSSEECEKAGSRPSVGVGRHRPQPPVAE